MSLTTTGAIAYEVLCPYCNANAKICGASCSSFEINEETKMRYCASDDYDNCPIFLVKKLLRR